MAYFANQIPLECTKEIYNLNYFLYWIVAREENICEHLKEYSCFLSICVTRVCGRRKLTTRKVIGLRDVQGAEVLEEINLAYYAYFKKSVIQRILQFSGPKVKLSPNIRDRLVYHDGIYAFGHRVD
jgi:hypothetical protein